MRSPRMALIGLSGALALCGRAEPAAPATTPVHPAASAPGQLAPAPPADPWSSPEVAAPRMADDLLRRPAPPGTRAGRPQTGGAPGSWLRTTASLAGIVALIVLLAWGYRLVTGGRHLGLGLRARHPGLIELVSRASLSPRQSLYLVRVGPQLVLIGATPAALRALSVIHDPELVARLAGGPAQETRARRQTEFNGCLDRAARAYAPDAPGRTDAPRERPVCLPELKRGLAQAAQRLRAVVART